MASLRLGAVAALMLAFVAVMAFVGVTSPRAQDVPQTRTVATQLRGSVQATARATVRHLYVYDGDAAGQDAVAAGMAKADADVVTSAAQLRALTRGTRAAAAGTRVQADAARFRTLVARALDASRSGRTAAARALYTRQIAPLLQQELGPQLAALQTQR